MNKQHSNCVRVIKSRLFKVLLPRDAMHLRYQPWACVRLSVCLCLPQSGVLLKRLNVGSHKQHRAIPQGLQFSDAKDLREIRPRSPPTRALNAGEVVKIGDFRQITFYISKTVKDRHIVSIKVEQEVVCALSNGDIAVDLECPQTTPFSAFCTAIHSFVTGEPRDFVFGTLTYHSKSHHSEEKSSL